MDGFFFGPFFKCVDNKESIFKIFEKNTLGAGFGGVLWAPSRSEEGGVFVSCLSSNPFLKYLEQRPIHSFLNQHYHFSTNHHL
jgi:hypothetical protein